VDRQPVAPLEHPAAATTLTGQSGGQIDRLVYCTARIDARTNPSGEADQDVYVKALWPAEPPTAI
jgi:hypothetical protein